MRLEMVWFSLQDYLKLGNDLWRLDGKYFGFAEFYIGKDVEPWYIHFLHLFEVYIR